MSHPIRVPERPGQLYTHTSAAFTTKLQCAQLPVACTSWVAAAARKPRLKGPLRQQSGGAHTLMICVLLGLFAVTIGPR